MSILIPIVILLAFFWFFVLLPQRRKQRAHGAMQNALGVGDEVITAGGLHGDVVGAEETVVRVEVAPDVVVRVDRRAIAARVEADDEEPEEPEDELVEPDHEQEPAESGSARDANRG